MPACFALLGGCPGKEDRRHHKALWTLSDTSPHCDPFEMHGLHKEWIWDNTRGTRWFFVATLLMTVLAGGLFGDTARAADPNFSQVTDILGGQRHLLRDDDLVFGEVPNFTRFVLGTRGLQIANQDPETVVNASCGGNIPSTRRSRPASGGCSISTATSLSVWRL